jgi:hypothetical protein
MLTEAAAVASPLDSLGTEFAVCTSIKRAKRREQARLCPHGQRSHLLKHYRSFWGCLHVDLAQPQVFSGSPASLGKRQLL